MNTNESYSLANPKGVLDTCAKFTIEDITLLFTLHDVMTIGEQYAFSFWIKSDAAGELKVYDNIFATNTNWQKRSMVFTANDTKLDFNFTVSGVYYIYHPKLELGNKTTDWTSAPEDLETRITDAETSISSNKEEISLRATKTELYSGLSEYKQASSSELQVTADAIKIDVSNLSTLYNELRMNYDFTAEGQIIGKKNSDTIMKLLNDTLQILISGAVVTELDTEGLTADMANIEVLRIGDYSLTKGTDGHLRII